MNEIQDREKLAASKKQWHQKEAQRPLKEKIAILLSLQRQDLELIQRCRALRSWERPWDIEP